MQTDTTYDGAGRAIQAVTKNYGVTRWTISTSYSGDTVATSAPAGGSASAVVTDALGRTTQRRDYAGVDPTGSTFTTTAFTYTPGGEQKTVTGPDDAVWSYTYDLHGRQVRAVDPDKGTTTSSYNALDQLVSTTDAEDKTVLYDYDELGRKISMWHGSKTDANKQAAWVYDTVAKGQLTSATRYVGGVTGKAYTKKVNTSRDSTIDNVFTQGSATRLQWRSTPST
jgi:YD repeat-containing protein